MASVIRRLGVQTNTMGLRYPLCCLRLSFRAKPFTVSDVVRFFFGVTASLPRSRSSFRFAFDAYALSAIARIGLGQQLGEDVVPGAVAAGLGIIGAINAHWESVNNSVRDTWKSFKPQPRKVGRHALILTRDRSRVALAGSWSATGWCARGFFPGDMLDRPWGPGLRRDPPLQRSLIVPATARREVWFLTQLVGAASRAAASKVAQTR